MYNQSMGRKSKRDERRADIVMAFARVLSQHGYAGATVLAVAEEAELSPGLLHHYFKNKREMLVELLDTLLLDFKARFRDRASSGEFNLETYIDSALKLDERANAIAAKCWVGILAEALKDKGLMDKIKRNLDSEIESIIKLSSSKMGANESSAILAFILGSLVFGAFAPKRASGFAAEMGKKFAEAIQG